MSEPRRAHRRLTVVFRLYDDGVGFRYEFPDQAQLRDVAITDELTEFDVAQPATAWWIPAGEPAGLEQIVEKAPLAEIGMADTPLTLAVPLAFLDRAGSTWPRSTATARRPTTATRTGSIW